MFTILWLLVSRAWAFERIEGAIAVYNPTGQSVNIEVTCAGETQATSVLLNPGTNTKIVCSQVPVKLKLGDSTREGIALGQCLDLVWSGGKLVFR